MLPRNGLFRQVTQVSVIAEEVEKHEAGPRVTSLELRGRGSLGGGLRRGAHTAGRVPGGVGVVTWTHDAWSEVRSAANMLPLTP